MFQSSRSNPDFSLICTGEQRLPTIPTPDNSARDKAYADVRSIIARVSWGYGKKLHGDAPTRGGSCAKGTYLPGSSDVDLVCLVSGMNPDQRQDAVETLYRRLKDSEASPYCYYGGKCFKRDSVKKSELVVKAVHENGTSFDIVVACHIESPGHFTNYDLNTAKHLSASAVLWQVPFILGKDDSYRYVVKLAKLWKNANTQALKEHCPTSFLRELLVLHAHQGCTVKPYGGEEFRLQVFRDFLALLASVEAKKKQEDIQVISWNANYGNNLIPQEEMRSESAGLVVVDPANPMNDVGSRLRDWAPLAKLAAETIQAFMMKTQPRLPTVSREEESGRVVQNACNDLHVDASLPVKTGCHKNSRSGLTDASVRMPEDLRSIYDAISASSNKNALLQKIDPEGIFSKFLLHVDRDVSICQNCGDKLQNCYSGRKFVQGSKNWQKGKRRCERREKGLERAKSLLLLWEGQGRPMNPQLLKKA